MKSNFPISQTKTLPPVSEHSSTIKWVWAIGSSFCIFMMFYSTIVQKIDNFLSPVVNAKVNFQNKNTSGQAGVLPVSTLTVNDIVTDALTFKSMLTTAQQSTLELSYTNALARKWSNLPCGTTCRNGIQLGTNLTSAQYAAATKIVKDALGTAANEGSDEFHQMNLAEAYLHANGGGSGYDSTLRWICFLNTPTASGPWMLQFGGHHYAANIAFNNGHVIGATPFFMGLEPKTFTYNSVAYDPLGDEKNALTAMLASLTSAQLATAKISSTFNDCVMIPGETNGGSSSFPAVAIGQPCSSLTTAQQNLVLAAIQLYVSDMDTATASHVMAVYTNEIAQTYISYVGSGTSGDASSFLISKSNYARISGPHVWIEFSCQGGIVIQNQIHYHTVWRDRTHDYGVDLTGPAIDSDASSGISELNTSKILKVYPNPAVSEINMSLPEQVIKSKISISDINGKTVFANNNFTGEKLNIPVSSLPRGQYFLYVRDSNHFYSGKFARQ